MCAATSTNTRKKKKKTVAEDTHLRFHVKKKSLFNSKNNALAEIFLNTLSIFLASIFFPFSTLKKYVIYSLFGMKFVLIKSRWCKTLDIKKVWEMLDEIRASKN